MLSNTWEKMKIMKSKVIHKNSYQVPLSWQALRPETQTALKELKSQSVSASSELTFQTLNLLAEDYLKQKHYHYAAGLYNYLLSLWQISKLADDNSNDTPKAKLTIDLYAKLQDCEQGFIKSLQLDPTHNPYPYAKISTHHRQQLQNLRSWCQGELFKLDKQYPFDIYDETKMKGQAEQMQQLQLAKAQAIRSLYHEIANQLKAFVNGLVNECIAVLGSPPCEYAIIALGSLAREEATPYSDLEFAILIKEEKEEYKLYFRHLTKLLHLKIINLGETILPSLGIPALNDYSSKDPLDRWFFDSITPRGFAFDGSMPQACKTPLGKNMGDGNDYELIHTPDQMIKFLGKKPQDPNEKYWFDYEPHLTMILITSALMSGSSKLVEIYHQLIANALSQPHSQSMQPLHQEWAFLLLKGEGFEEYEQSGMQISSRTAKVKGDVQEFEIGLYDGADSGKLYDVKKEIYRLPDRVLERLAIYYGITWSTVWERLELLGNIGYISKDNVLHLKITCGIALELRLRAYLSKQGQFDNLTVSEVLALTSPWQKADSDKSTSLQPSNWQLFRYYFTALPLYKEILMFCRKNRAAKLEGEQKYTSLGPTLLFDAKLNVQAGIYARLLNYPESKKCWEGWLKQHPDDSSALNNLAYISQMLGDSQGALKYNLQVLKLRQEHSGEINPDIALSLNNLGETYRVLSNAPAALKCHQQALEIWQSTYGDLHPLVATSVANIAATYDDLGFYQQALNCHEQALEIRQKIYGEHHPDVATSLNDLATEYLQLGYAETSLLYQQKALAIRQSIYGDEHPDVAVSFNNIGDIYCRLGYADKGLKYHYQALAIRRKLYGEQHPDVASSLSNLGTTYLELGSVKQALNYHYQALTIRRKLFGEEHFAIALGLNNIGATYQDLGRIEEGLKLQHYALQILQKLYGYEHPNVAASLSNVAEKYRASGQITEALKYHTDALAIRLKLYGPQHPDVGISLNNLGVTYNEAGNKQEALNCHHQALEICQKAYGTQHPRVATSLSNIAETYKNLGNFKEALAYQRQALAMKQKFQGNHHPDVAISLTNLGWLIYEVNGDDHEALDCHRQALEIWRKLYGSQHPNIAISLNGLAGGYLNLGEAQLAFNYFRQAYLILLNHPGHGKNHSLTQMVLESLVSLNNLMTLLYKLSDPINPMPIPTPWPTELPSLEILLKNFKRSNFLLSELEQAIRQNNAEAVKKLVVAGAAVNGQNVNETVLHQAVAHNNMPIVNCLLEYGADVNALDIEGNIPLKRVSNKNKQGLLMRELLLAKGSNINHQNYQGNSLLHLSAQEGCWEVVELLVQKEIDINLCNQQGKTAAQLAQEHGYQDLADFLISLSLSNMSEQQTLPSAKIEVLHDQQDEIDLFIKSTNVNTSSVPHPIADTSHDLLTEDMELAAALELSMQLEAKTPQKLTQFAIKHSAIFTPEIPDDLPELESATALKVQEVDKQDLGDDAELEAAIKLSMQNP